MQDKLIEAKRLQEVYAKLGVTECYCSQNSSSECPKHIAWVIASLERSLGLVPGRYTMFHGKGVTR